MVAEDISRTIEEVTPYGINDVFSFGQSGDSFTANKKLNDRIPPRLGNGTAKLRLINADGTVTAQNR